MTSYSLSTRVTIFGNMYRTLYSDFCHTAAKGKLLATWVEIDRLSRFSVIVWVASEESLLVEPVEQASRPVLTEGLDHW